jgi:hypothetical protein
MAVTASTRAALRPSNFSVGADVAGLADVAAWANDLSVLNVDERVAVLDVAVLSSVRVEFT